jgi:hypothetical protein
MSEHKTGNSTYDKKTYWERRKAGLRGQSPVITKEVKPTKKAAKK